MHLVCRLVLRLVARLPLRTLVLEELGVVLAVLVLRLERGGGQLEARVHLVDGVEHGLLGHLIAVGTLLGERVDRGESRRGGRLHLAALEGLGHLPRGRAHPLGVDGARKERALLHDIGLDLKVFRQLVSAARGRAGRGCGALAVQLDRLDADAPAEAEQLQRAHELAELVRRKREAHLHLAHWRHRAFERLRRKVRGRRERESVRQLLLVGQRQVRLAVIVHVTAAEGEGTLRERDARRKRDALKAQRQLLPRLEDLENVRLRELCDDLLRLARGKEALRGRGRAARRAKRERELEATTRGDAPHHRLDDERAGHARIFLWRRTAALVTRRLGDSEVDRLWAVVEDESLARRCEAAVEPAKLALGQRRLLHVAKLRILVADIRRKCQLSRQREVRHLALDGHRHDQLLLAHLGCVQLDGVRVRVARLDGRLDRRFDGIHFAQSERAKHDFPIPGTLVGHDKLARGHRVEQHHAKVDACVEDDLGGGQGRTHRNSEVLTIRVGTADEHDHLVLDILRHVAVELQLCLHDEAGRQLHVVLHHQSEFAILWRNEPYALTSHRHVLHRHLHRVPHGRRDRLKVSFGHVDHDMLADERSVGRHA